MRKARSRFSKQTNWKKLFSETPEAAYWLGFIMSDGFVRPGNGLVVSLAEVDRPHLEKLAKFLETEVSIATYSQRGGKYPFCSLHISDVRLHDELTNYGVPTKKTKTWRLSNLKLPSHLLCHFFRGYWDGDGSIFTSSDGSKITVSLAIHCGPAQEVYDWHVASGVRLGMYCKWHSPENLELKSQGIKKAKMLYDVVHGDAYPRMERKWQKVEGWLASL